MILQNQNIIKIAITGPESTGKSTLSKTLAEHYQTSWSPEFAREYIQNLNRPYEFEDLHIIALGQLELENKMKKYINRILFCDTDFLVLKIWSEHKFGKVGTFIQDHYQKNSYDLTLLLDIDLPWQYDPQREHPDQRQFFFDWYLEELKKSNATFKIVSGNAEERTSTAIRYIDEMFS